MPLWYISINTSLLAQSILVVDATVVGINTSLLAQSLFRNTFCDCQ